MLTAVVSLACSHSFLPLYRSESTLNSQWVRTNLRACLFSMRGVNSGRATARFKAAADYHSGLDTPLQQDYQANLLSLAPLQTNSYCQLPSYLASAFHQSRRFPDNHSFALPPSYIATQGDRRHDLEHLASEQQRLSAKSTGQAVRDSLLITPCLST